jgi:hypothetical protein
MSTLLKDQSQGSPYRGLPVEEKNDSSALVSITGETVQFYYSNAGTRTTDAGQAIGVAVEAVLAYDNIKNSQGKSIGNSEDKSLSFTSTAFTTEKTIDSSVLESLDGVSWSARLTAITSGLSNGEYVVDYQKGILYGKKASTQTSLTSTAYLIRIGYESSYGSVTAVISSPITPTGGSTTVTTAGTAVALGASLVIKSVYIRAKAGNTSFVCVGDSAVDESTNQQIVLYAGDSVSIDIANRASVYLDADVNGEGVDYLCLT